jgi:hypothetical protein
VSKECAGPVVRSVSPPVRAALAAAVARERDTRLARTRSDSDPNRRCATPLPDAAVGDDGSELEPTELLRANDAKLGNAKYGETPSSDVECMKERPNEDALPAADRGNAPSRTLCKTLSALRPLALDGDLGSHGE